MLEHMLKTLKFNTLTPIQEQMFKALDDPRHIVGLAPTGTGKTYAYLLPILSKIDMNLKAVQAVILVPTNELVIQVSAMLKAVQLEALSYKSYYGSMDMQKEVTWLSKNQPSLVITTPSKLFELVRTNQALKIHEAKYLVLDEADMLFDDEFLSLIDGTLSSLQESKILLFSATITKAMTPFINKYFGTYLLIDTTKDHHLKIEYLLVKEGYDRKETLIDITKVIQPYLALIFVSKKENAKALFEALSEQNLNICYFSSDLNVKQRKKLLENIHDNVYQYVIASDLMARGIDFKASHVIQYDLPYELDFFFHRAGRTGRMNDTGTVITLFGERDRSKLDKIKNRGIEFKMAQVTKDGLTVIVKKRASFTEEEAAKIKKIKTSTKVTPNYKKKHQALVKEQVKKIKRSKYIRGTKNR